MKSLLVKSLQYKDDRGGHQVGPHLPAGFPSTLSLPPSPESCCRQTQPYQGGQRCLKTPTLLGEKAIIPTRAGARSNLHTRVPGQSGVALNPGGDYWRRDGCYLWQTQTPQTCWEPVLHRHSQPSCSLRPLYPGSGRRNLALQRMCEPGKRVLEVPMPLRAGVTFTCAVAVLAIAAGLLERGAGRAEVHTVLLG